jgi:hypothetical protein
MPKMLPFRANFRDRLETVTTNDNDKEHEDQCSGVVWEWSGVQKFTDRMRILAALYFAASQQWWRIKKAIQS